MIKGVTIAGTSWALDQVLADVTIRQGRQAWDAQPQAATATITLWDAPADLPPSVGVGNQLTLTTTQGAARFTGRVTDSTVTFPDPYQGARVTLTAVGPLAELGRVYVGAEDWPEEAATARVARLFAAAGVTAGVCECPPAHDYLVAARPASRDTALAVLTQLATTMGAAIYDTPTGEVVVQSLHARGSAAALDLPAASVAFAPAWRQAWEVENSVRVKYQGGELVETSASSIATWGLRENTIETTLATVAAARDRGLSRLTRLAQPRWHLGEVTTNILPHELPLAPGQLLNVAPDQALALPLPAHPMVVEGWTDQQRGDTWTTTLYLSDGVLSFAQLKWTGVPPTYTWATIKPTTAWANATTAATIKPTGGP